MMKTILLTAMGLSLMAVPLHAGQGNLAMATADASKSYSLAGWGVKKLRVGTRKKVKRTKSARRSKKVRHSSTLHRQNFAAPGGFRLRRGGFNDDHTPGNGR